MRLRIRNFPAINKPIHSVSKSTTHSMHVIFLPTHSVSNPNFQEMSYLAETLKNSVVNKREEKIADFGSHFKGKIALLYFSVYWY